MSRELLEAALQAHVPADEKEAADRAAMLVFLAALPAPFSAEQGEAHFTASALVVDAHRTRTCLVLHRKLGLWLQPGGHVEDGDESIALAALREVREETGLDARLADGAPVHLDVRFLTVAHTDELTLSEESTDVRWWPLAEAAKAGDDSLARLIRAATLE
jgi:8-oxo-dGTP pyrophosphatase MutT (NUDIX family)